MLRCLYFITEFITFAIMKLLAAEIWRDIPGYEGYYQASTLGNIRSVSRTVKSTSRNSNTYIKKLESVILSQATNDKVNYKQKIVILSIEGKHRTCVVARLIAATFIPNPNNLPQINHKDEDPTNNKVSNLEWCDSNYNNNYGLRSLRESNTKTKYRINQYDKSGEFIKTWRNSKDIQRELGINHSSVLQCCRGERKQAGGFIWKFDEQVS